MATADRLERCAWSDESFDEVGGAGFYIVAAAIIDDGVRDQVRYEMTRLRGARRGPGKLHWTEMDDRQRKDAVATVGSLGGLHVVAVGTPVPLRRQERARSKVVHELVRELRGFGVDHLFMEAREAELNRRDVRTVGQARRFLPPGATFRVTHVHGRDEPLLWVADVVAGVCRFEQKGRMDYRAGLGERVLDFHVFTGCRPLKSAEPGSRSAPGHLAPLPGAEQPAASSVSLP